MNSTIETLLNHRSIRKFTEQPISEDTLTTILDCGIAASSSSFIQCTSVIRITEPDARQQLAIFAGNQPYVATAAEFLVFCIDFHRHQQINPEAQLGYTEQTLIGAVDTALMAQNCLVAAESLALGGVYIGGIRNNPAKVAELLRLPDHVMPLFGLCLGYPAQNPEPKPRLPQSLVIHQEHYQAEFNHQALAEYDDKVSNYYRTRTGGKKDTTWSQQITETLNKEARPFMQRFIRNKGFSTR
ncbi:NADPH-dependent oxidoreductase [Photobacterium jeanii]|uniref:NADPH-dependent oxidoreductase n=1 Tax=Photobacterium jeanii TaxID=858640 RepID=A0A178K9F1_9GAMM|nr:oxygen-insensitive NADPH nitroreductase [Photobacterium jeanii]OAN13696.1 NADPH-dependent oxidoreductase [Photobacterium jeanii]PST88817.1 oxygen-insensitive NADPH nitroreductase [Photobacterium jeanii]